MVAAICNVSSKVSRRNAQEDQGCDENQGVEGIVVAEVHEVEGHQRRLHGGDAQRDPEVAGARSTHVAATVATVKTNSTAKTANKTRIGTTWAIASAVWPEEEDGGGLLELYDMVDRLAPLSLWERGRG